MLIKQCTRAASTIGNKPHSRSFAMQQLPHHYFVGAAASQHGSVILSSPGLTELATAPPAEFGGPGDLWSPETLLVGAVANCFILSFRAIARASKLEWQELSCQVEGVLDRLEGKTRFTDLNLVVKLQIGAATDEVRAQRILEKAEETCLITNSMTARIELTTDIAVV